jgi:hypothetical protein
MLSIAIVTITYLSTVSNIYLELHQSTSSSPPAISMRLTFPGKQI